MSAITGLIHFNEEPVALAHGTGLMEALRKYPADDVQVWYQERIFLGCHGQWITPESIGERNPYNDSERQLAITADAIIDNRNELFDLLQVEHGLRRTMPDNVLILLAYDKWGEESPKYLIGDFAYMIWDERKRRLFGARDFSGSRTLYFHQAGNRFAFCTLIEPLFTLPHLEKKLNEEWIAEFLAIPLTVDAMDGSVTVYESIRQIPPSHSLVAADGRVTLTRYCHSPAGKPLKLKSNEEYEEAFRDVFQQAVTARLRTHRQVGAHLSGGLDSGSVASFAARSLRSDNKRLHTFSYVPVDDFKADWTPKSRFANERPYIQSTVQHVGNISDNYLDFKGLSPLTEIDDWLETMEMPYKFFENSYWLKGIYEQANQKEIGILLNGQRGNWTISWGPALDYQVMLMKNLKWRKLYREATQFSMNMGTGRKRVLSLVGKKAFPFIGQLFTPKEAEFPSLINPHFAQRTNVQTRIQAHGFDRTDYGNQSAYAIRKNQFEQLYYWSLNGTIGTKLSLRYSLWERDPTNDLRVARFCLSVPEDQYVQNGVDRSLIRRATAGYLPDQIRLNQRTRGVQGADGVHRMAASWQAFIHEMEQHIQDPRISEYLNIHELKRALSEIKEAKPEYVYQFGFRILMRGLIFSRFIKKFA
ncbi:asparagine synthase-related protein [Bacillus sp. 3255]|uniref:asparagine synthase-related protein n=1 Tax=Bacillus sp. 3255 TaxID=2817904 RepID=UPI00285CC5EA|nr:asparagine synthase-related protein [Bacillus sp. 3255]MDR6878668.1 asparagine synthase (glutamine-hydrolyzing) [Bacillus sp. 3255]